MSTPRPYPLQPLLDAAGITRSQLQKRTKTSGADMCKSGREGCTLSQADRWAVRCGFHPIEVWQDLWIDEGISPDAWKERL